MNPNDSNTRLVYSTSAAVPHSRGTVRVSYDTKGRKGKVMTLISGLPLSESGLLDLAKKLKQRFGTGGSVKGHVIELQGDHRKQAAQELRKLGFHAQPT